MTDTVNMAFVWNRSESRLPGDKALVLGTAEGAHPDGTPFQIVLPMWFHKRWHCETTGETRKNCFVDANGVVRFPETGIGHEQVTYWADMPEHPAKADAPAIHSASDYHTASLRVPLYEIDLGQGVYHGNYYHFFELAREQFLRDMGFTYKRLMEMKLHLTVAEASCRYKKSLYYDDRIDIHTRISWMRHRSIGIVQQICKKGKDGKPVLCTDLSLSLVCVAFEGGAVPLPPEFRQCLEKHTDAQPE